MLRQGRMLESCWLEISPHASREDFQRDRLGRAALKNIFPLSSFDMLGRKL
jgi:hypothetical protein